MNVGEHPLVDGLPPRWATEWGEDQFGPFVAFAIGGVVQRMRWIPAGRFLMGSPEEEVGRWGDEGPQHVVTLSQGLWLGETPVTQALWESVVGSNPSRFVSRDRPVEQVNWDDCQEFVKLLNRQVPGLKARLPTEAEWERACRGGTTAATWLGDLVVRGERDVPLLDAIAWYSGNSGIDYNLPNGEDSSGWLEKQYDHKRAGSHPVGQKEPNPLGLHDMLGNVHEWCRDFYASYGEAAVVDPSGPLAGSRRAVRGGNWILVARVVRAARRYGFPPAYRSDSLGFRLAQGHGSALNPAR